MNIIEYDDCVYGLSKDLELYILAEVKNIMQMDGFITSDELERAKDLLNAVQELHNDCSGMCKLYENPMASGLYVVDLD